MYTIFSNKKEAFTRGPRRWWPPARMCENKVEAFQNRVKRLTQIFTHLFSTMYSKSLFGPKMDEITGVWRRLHNEEKCVVLPNKYYSDDQIKKNEVGRTCSTYRERSGAHRVAMEKPKERRELGRLRGRWEDNIKVDLREVDWGGGDMDWISLPEDRKKWWSFVNAVMNLRFP